jgi:hypothetical protein
MKPRPIPWLNFALAVLAGLAGATALALFQQGGWPSQGHQYALAIERGEREALHAPLDAEETEDGAITHNAREAGYSWAERHSLDDAAKCAPLPGDDKLGCEDWVSEQR